MFFPEKPAASRSRPPRAWKCAKIYAAFVMSFSYVRPIGIAACSSSNAKARAWFRRRCPAFVLRGIARNFSFLFPAREFEIAAHSEDRQAQPVYRAILPAPLCLLRLGRGEVARAVLAAAFENPARRLSRVRRLRLAATSRSR